MKGDKLKLLLVDDSPTVRAVLKRIVRNTPELLVVGEAGDGRRAVEMCRELSPDVILMDLAMPGMDGFEATSAIMNERPTAILVLSSEVRVHGKRTVFDAVERGALGVLAKPETPAAWTDLAERLPAILRAVATDYAKTHGENASAAAIRDYEKLRPAGSRQRDLEVLAVGASTGGPEALRMLLHGLGPRPPLPVLVVQHIAAEFEEGLAEWLRGDLTLDVGLAREGESLRPGMVRLGPQGSHLRLGKDRCLHLDTVTPPLGGHRPSATELFRSCAEVLGPTAAGVVLSGMGRDGVDGLLALRHAGGVTLVQDRDSSTIFGMPMAAIEAGAAEVALSPAEIARSLLEIVQSGHA